MLRARIQSSTRDYTNKIKKEIRSTITIIIINIFYFNVNNVCVCCVCCLRCVFVHSAHCFAVRVPHIVVLAFYVRANGAQALPCFFFRAWCEAIIYVATASATSSTQIQTINQPKSRVFLSILLLFF